MDFQAAGSEARFSDYVAGLVSVIGHGSGTTAAGLLPWTDDGLPTQERGAGGSENGTGADGSAASIAVIFCRRRGLVGRNGPRQSSGDGAAVDRASRTDRGLDHRRHRLSQKGHAFGGGGAAILRPARQAGQLPGRSVVSLVNRHASLPVAYRLYLPEVRASDAARRRKAGVPAEIGFQTKPEIALEQIRAAGAVGQPRGVV